MDKDKAIREIIYKMNHHDFGWYIPHILFVAIAIGLFAYISVDTYRRRPYNGLTHVLCAAGFMIFILARALAALRLRSDILPVLLVVAGELAAAAGIFMIRPEPSADPSRPFHSLSRLGRMNLLANLGVIVALLVLGSMAIELRGLPSKKVATEMLIMLLGAMPIFVALGYQAVRHLRLR